jgi:hypothetical protein
MSAYPVYQHLPLRDLPPKHNPIASLSSKVVEERKRGLENFLQGLVDALAGEVVLPEGHGGETLPQVWWTALVQFLEVDAHVRFPFELPTKSKPEQGCGASDI